MKGLGFEKAASVEENPLVMLELRNLLPKSREILVKITVCGICLTDRHQIEGDLPQRYSPTIPGHQIVGRVVKKGKMASKFNVGERVGVSWIYSACGKCAFCLMGNENLCNQAKFTGWDVQGGYSQYIVVDQNFAYSIPTRFADSQAAPLLCAGVIGYRSLRLSNIRPGQSLGLFGFGASAHIVIQIAKYWNCKVYAFDRKEEAQKIAKSLGADWSGFIKEEPPEKLESAIVFAPSEDVILTALEALQKGGRLVINAISIEPRKEKEFNYQKQLWYEKEIKSVANVTRKDIQQFLHLATKIPILTRVHEFTLKDANHALIMHKQGKIRGTAILRID